MVAPSEPGSSKPTCSSIAASKVAAIPSITEGSGIAGPSVKKPRFSPKRVSKKKAFHQTTKPTTSDASQGSSRMFLGCSKQQFFAAKLTQVQDPNQEGIPIDRHNSCAELEDYHFEDLVTVPDEFFE